jgi:hypothetical protein
MLMSTLFMKILAKIGEKNSSPLKQGSENRAVKIMGGFFGKNSPKRIARHLVFWGLIVLGGMSLVGAGCGGGDGGAEVDGAASTTIVLTSFAVSATEVSLSWSGGLSGGEKYDVYKDDVFYATTLNNTITVTGLDPDKRYCFKVFKVDPATGILERSNISCTATQPRSLAGKRTASRSVGPSPEKSDTVSAWSIETYPPNGWTFQAVDGVGPGCTSTAIALDSVYKVYILYAERSPAGRRLVLASPLGGLWTKDVIDASGDVASGMGISVDGRDGVHVVYWDTTNSQLKYAGKTSETWLRETVDGVLHEGSAPSIQADWWGEVSISYIDPLNHALKCANKSSGEWQISVVDWTNMTGDGADVSMALDSQNRLHIGYYDGEAGLFPKEEGVLKYATTDAQGNWHVRIIDRAPALGGFPALAMDSWDTAHMAYFDAAAFALKYATNPLGTWDIRVIDRVGDGIRSVSLAVDVADRVHIAYIEGAQQRLKYATNARGQWTVTTLDRGVCAAARVSIAADSLSRVCISYIKGDVIRLLTN